ncbi:ferrous iron transport protein A [Leptothermofonsia sichuanensis]|uniref:ferrous iron transport protein A n=1 Tax=Leptothermofonsia sichuanensis TaxID=2917832 RepID=UPI001CEC8585|nr:ferrous iron transport protein A [Leptothermofonsia sichuanensis]
MLTTGFSVQGTSLKLLRSQERGVITRISSICDATAQKLRKLGLAPGQTIAIEQRFPRFIVRVGRDCHALDETVISAIYVRIVGH